MEKFRKILIKYGGAMAAFALTVNVVAFNPICHFFFHEPEVPEELSAYKFRQSK